MDEKSNLWGMDPRDIPARLSAAGKRQADLARFMGLDPSSLTKTIKGDRQLKATEAAKIEEFFDGGGEPGTVARLSSRREAAPRRIPVYGYAAGGGDDRIAFADNRVLDWVEPPPFWNGHGDLIYVRLIGESMAPRYFSGEILPVRLNYPPARGQDCLIVFTDGSSVVKTYKSQHAGQVFAEQYNEAKEVRYDATGVQALHAIWKPGMV